MIESFKVLNFDMENDSTYIFDKFCFDKCFPKLNEMMSRKLYGQLNPEQSEFSNAENILIIDRNFISHQIVGYEIIDKFLIVEIEILANINGVAVLECKKKKIPIYLYPRLVIYDSTKLDSGKIRINDAEIITFDLFTD